MTTVILQPRQQRPFAFDRFLMQLVTFTSYEKHICQMSLFALPIKLCHSKRVHCNASHQCGTQGALLDTKTVYSNAKHVRYGCSCYVYE